GTGPAALFDRIALVTHGGYVGAALAWVGLTLFGPAISAILLIGVAIVGVIVIGFSISAFLFLPLAQETPRVDGEEELRDQGHLAAGAGEFESCEGRLR
ncbi:hypothetical protein, partial [Adlercreutzia sp. DFI.6.23]|uniref:hypothetical protein n=1 Tax=Adlercreutzia sp. DFI.6.23 TaxID=2963705 RepID=UPI00210BA010